MSGAIGSGPSCRRRWPVLCLLILVLPAAAVAVPDSAPPRTSGELESRLGVPIFPGAELLNLEGPTREVVDLERPGWEFVSADVLVADFLVGAPIAELRRFYRPLTVRDPKLLLIGKDAAAGEIISLRHSGRHPLHPRKRWLRIVTYRLAAPPAGADTAAEPQLAGE